VSWASALLAAVAVAGWSLVLALGLTLRSRLALLADAEHELRGAVAAIGLAAERMARTGASMAFVSLVRLQLDRMAAGLADLSAARALRSPVATDPDLDAGRLAQVLGNLIANATEHGVGLVDVQSDRTVGAVRLEIRNRNRPRELNDLAAARPSERGRGLAIAERAARELGGRLSVESSDGETRAALELPVDGEAQDEDARHEEPVRRATGVAVERSGAPGEGASGPGGRDGASPDLPRAA
jgi:two-component sensor histidine kinase